MSVAVDRRPGASSLVQAQSAPAAPAATPGKQTVTQQLPPGDAASPAAATTYVVQRGDTLPGIAIKLRTGVDALKVANADQIKSFATSGGGVVQGFNAGAVLRVPGATAAAPATPAATTPAATTPVPDASAPAATAPAATAPAATTPAATTSAATPAPDASAPTTPASAASAPAAPAAAAAATPAPTPAPTTPAPPAAAPAPAASDGGGGVVDRMVGALEGAWEYFTGSSSTPAADPATPPGASSGTPAPGAAPAAPTRTTPAPLGDLSDAERGQQLSTFSPGEVPKDPRDRPAAAAASAAKRGQWLSTDQVTAAGAGKSGDAFVASIDKMNAGAKFTDDQNQMIAAAKNFAAAPQPLTAAQEAHAVMDWSGAVLTLGSITLDADLKARVARFVRFAAWANLVTGPTPVGSVMRSAADAHLWSTAWMFNVKANTKSANTLNSAANRQKLVQNVTDRGGSDADGNTWLSPSTVEGLKSHKDDDAALFDYIKTTAVADAAKVKTFPNQAAEGYTTADKRHPNVFPGSKVSNHLTGEAVDMSPPWVFNNKYDPVIDAMAAYFGLSRPLKDSSNPEHWHFERLGTPPAPEEEAH